MSNLLRAAGAFAVLSLIASPALAQQPKPADTDVIASHQPADQPPPVDQVERIGPSGGTRTVIPRPGGGEGVRIVKPGALLFASYDTNHDGKISPAELIAGAEASFAVADKNGDGMLTGFEQNDWAFAVGSAGDVLTNPMTFDVNLDRKISKQEFVEGLKKLSQPVLDAATGQILFSALITPLSSPGQGQQASASPPSPPPSQFTARDR